MLFENKIAVIFGGGGGMGSAISKRFAKEGAKVVVVDLYTDDAKLAVEAIIDAGGEAEFIQCDTGVEDQVEGVMTTIEKKYGRLDLAVNANGGQVTSPLVIETTEQRFREIMESNLTGVFFVMKHEAKLMIKSGGGAIVTISSLNSFVPHPRLSIYGASKAAVDMLCKTMAMEVGPLGVRVNTIQPGFTKTPKNIMTQKPEIVSEILYKTPTRRMNEPEYIASAAAFLCSDEAFNITATSLLIDGGGATEGYPDTHEILNGLPRTYEGPELK